MIHLAIVDDETYVCETLQAQIQQFMETESLSCEIHCFPNSESCLADDPLHFDIFFLDIQMSGMDGMACARELRNRGSKAEIIFVTSMVQFAVQGYQVEALDYIVKPVTYAQIETALRRACARLHAKLPDTVLFHTKDGEQPIHVMDILCAEAVNHQVVLHLKSIDVACTATLSAIESALAPYGFYRCHAAFVVNLSLIEKVTVTDAIVQGGQVPVSKHRRKALLQAMTSWWSKRL